jgi:hypothetical protein
VFNYSRQVVVKVIGQVPLPLNWQKFQIILEYLSPIISASALNHSHGHWLINDVLHFAFFMNLKLKEENQIVVSFESFMADDSVVIDELSLLASNIKREVINVPFSPFHS